MTTDQVDQPEPGAASAGEATEAEARDASDAADESGPPVRAGDYTWAEFMAEYGHGDEVSTLYADDGGDQLGLEADAEVERAVPRGEDWNRVEFDPRAYLGRHPDDLEGLIADVAKPNAETLREAFLEYVDPETTPVVKDVWTWEHYKWEYYYEDDGSRPRDGDGEVIPHDEAAALGCDPDDLETFLSAGESAAAALEEVVDERTVNVQEDVDEDAFFSTAAGNTTVTNRYDLEKAVPMEKKTHFREVERYWVNEPYACVVVFHSERENEKKYYVIEPYLNEIEADLQAFLTGKLKTAIKYSGEDVAASASRDGRRRVIEDETRRLLERYDLYERTSGSTTAGLIETLQNLLDDDEDDGDETPDQLEGIEVRPEPAILDDDPDTLSEYQVEKLLYLLKRDFIGYERIDGIKHDINVEDISCDGYNSPVFVYHSEYEQIITNVYHGEDELDDFVVKLAQRSGKGISKRLPQVDSTLPDGSRAQLTLGQEVSDHGTNYTIRQFKDVPFTPIDLINWNTFSLDEMAFLWLAIENHKSLIFAGGTASGKTTSLNAVSLFIPSSAKIVSIEDTREVELPQRNWIASVTRPSFSDDEQGDVDEFDLLEAALRQRPDYIVMGEIRGEEGRTLFQVMSTGHTTYTTFHADSVDEVLKRFTTDPINVSKTMFTALDLVSIQTQTRVQGRKVRRNKSLTEINHFEAEHDEINVQDVYQWQAETDEFLKMGDSNTLEEIRFDRGWDAEKLEEELFIREVILAYLIKNGLNTYAEVAATAQAFINDPDTILTLIANGQLEESLADLREMESVLIDVDPEKEELVPRPEATTETYDLSTDILEQAEESLFEEYRGRTPNGLASALGDLEGSVPSDDEGDATTFDFADVETETEDEWDLEDGADGFATADETASPAWLGDDGEFEVGSSEAATAESTELVPADDADQAAEATDDGPDGESAATTDEPTATADEPTATEPAERADDPSPLPASGSTDGIAERAESERGRADAEPVADESSSDGDASDDLDALFAGDALESVFEPAADDGAELPATDPALEDDDADSDDPPTGVSDDGSTDAEPKATDDPETPTARAGDPADDEREGAAEDSIFGADSGDSIFSDDDEPVDEADELSFFAADDGEDERDDEGESDGEGVE